MRRFLSYLALVWLLVCMLACLHASTAAAQSPRLRAASDGILLDAVCLLEDGRIKEARTILETLRREDPTNDAVHYYIGLCDFREKKFDDAVSSISRAVEIDSANLWYRETLASVYSARGDNDKAAGIYEWLYKKDPRKFTTPFILTMLGDRDLAAYRDSSALARYDQALGLDPLYAPALLGKAEAYRMRGNLPAFFVSMDEFVRNEDVIPVARAQYLDNILSHVDARMYRGWGAQLDSLVDAGVRTCPADSSMLKLAGRWFYGTGRKDKGRAYFGRLLEAYPEDMGANLINVQLLMADNLDDEVIAACGKMLAFCEGHDRATVYSILGDTWHRKGDSRRAYKAYEQALKLDPEFTGVLNNYAYYLSLEGHRLRKAARMSKITIEKQPDNPTFLDTYGWILHLLGRDAEAKVHFKRAIVYGGSDSAVILGHYAEVLRALGEKDLAAYYEGQAERKKK